ncbi:phage Gp37/Gp68 family protein [Flavobacteriaceae bacterium]|nr:phage Gp37/Gp68 family protein [Flavobacteriaceae bacterium]
MSDKTNISWTDHTQNFWWGCTKIAPGCDNCYAATFDKRVGGNHWAGPDNAGADKPRLTKDANWRKPYRWNRQAESDGIRRRVFCGSMMDWCDKNAPDGARERMWQVIRETPWLDWQLLTKRATLIERCLPDDWGDGYDNVWLGVTVENVEYGFPRIEALSKIPAKVRFLSCEPLIGPLDGLHTIAPLNRIHWAIIGGESGPGARPMEYEWAGQAMLDFDLWDIPVWFKQWGGVRPDSGGHLFDGDIYQSWPLGHEQNK